MRNASWPYYDKGTLVGGRSGPRPDKAEIIKLGPAEVLTKLRHVSAVLLGMRGSKCMFLVKSCLRIVSDDVGSALVIGHLQRRSSRPKSAITGSAQRPSVHLSSFKPRQLRRPKEKLPEGCEAWSFQSTPADCRAWKVSSIRKSGLSRSFFASWARTPLTIVAHILPGRRVVVRPTLGAIGSISARYHGADACLNTAEPAAADVHRTAIADSAEPHGESRGCNC